MQFLVVLLFLVFEFLFAFVVVVAAATVGSGILFIVFWFLAMVVFCGFFFLPLVMLAKQFAPPRFARDGYR